MKRLIPAAILLIFVITAYITGYFYTTRTCDTASEMLNECITIYKSDKNAHNSAKELEKFWGEREGTLSVFANHADIDQIELAIGSLVVYSNSPDNKIFYEYSGTVKTLLHQLIEDSKPSMHSIL